MKVRAIRPYTGPVDADGLVDVYDLSVEPNPVYGLAAGVYVSNSKRISLLDVNALLSHGATDTLRDSGSVRGQRNEDWWLQFMQGHTPREPGVPKVYEKFVNQMKGAGINVVRDGSKMHVMALTNSDVDRLAGDRVIRSGDTVRFDKDLEPVAGGLFDPKLTGGHGGNAWSAIELHEPMPSPVMEDPIRRLLDLTKKKFEGVLSGEETLGGYGSGPKAIHAALDAISMPRAIAQARTQMHGSSQTKRDDAVRKLGYLKAAVKYDLKPADWMLARAPVLPPAFRPVSVMSGDRGDVPLVADANYLYRELFQANENLKAMKADLGEDGVGPERLAVYHAFKAVTGLGDPVHPKLQQKNVTGLLKTIFGSSPKFGSVQRKLISSTVDNVGRAVITPNPEFDMDTVGLPEDKAFDVYGKFIARRLHRRGMPLSQAVRQVRDRTELAHAALTTEMEERPVYINRAPVLHKYGVMAFRPKLVKGNVMQVSPLIVKGFNADFDGDMMQFHVPSTDESVKEAYERMLPSANLLSPADFKSPVHAPVNEFVGGLYHATSGKSERRPRTFRSRADVLGALARHEISPHDQVHILEG